MEERPNKLTTFLADLLDAIGVDSYVHFRASAGHYLQLLGSYGHGDKDVTPLLKQPELLRLANRAAERGEPIIVQESEDPDAPRIDFGLNRSVRSWALFCLKSPGEWREFFLLTSPEPGTFDDRNTNLVERVGGFLAGGGEYIEEQANRLRRLILQLTETEERERRRIADLFHGDLQQFLAGAKVHVDIAARRTKEDSFLSDRLETATKLLNEVIERTRVLSHELSPDVVRRRGLLVGFETLASQMARSHGLTVQIENKGELPPIRENERMIIYRAVQELLFNVAKHAGVETARVVVSREAGTLSIAVLDHGKGFEVPDTVQAHAPAGLGLVTVKERIEAIGGTLEVESVLGGGSTFTIRLPVPEASEAPAAQKDAPPAQETGAKTKATTILLVDDHAVIRQGLAVLLNEESDLQVIAEADDGQAAVEAVRHYRPEIVIMDLAMPRMEGDEATRMISREFPETIVLGLSMHSEGDAARRMLDAGAAAHLPKEGPSEQVISTIRRLRA